MAKTGRRSGQPRRQVDHRREAHEQDVPSPKWLGWRAASGSSVAVLKAGTLRALPWRITYQESPLKQNIESSLREASTALDTLLQNQPALTAIENAASLLVNVFEQKGRVYACGNGGSMCDAMHFAENYRDQTS